MNATFERIQTRNESYAMPLNLEKYRPYLDDFDMIDEQKDEFIRSIWVIMQSFADYAHGLSPTQQVCEFKPDKVCLKKSPLVESGYQPNIDKEAANDNFRRTGRTARKNKS